MKIGFLTEMGFSGKIPRNHRNMRVEFAWMCALDAEHISLTDIVNKEETYDVIVAILPKKNLNIWIELSILDIARKKCKRFSIMQEGPHWYFQDYDVYTQFWYYNQLCQTDILFVHNDRDMIYYKGILNHKNVHVLPSLLIEDSIKNIPIENRESVMIGGNFVSWYGGFDSYIVSLELKTKMICPSMGRKQQQESLISDINYLPYLDWVGWMESLNTCKYGVHLMRTHAAGTFALNCAYFGIPCIGYSGLDTQSTCFPDITCDVADVVTAKKFANQLLDDEFYKHVSEKSRELYKTHFSEEIFLKKVSKLLI